MELIGIPHRLVIGDRSLEQGVIEYKHRCAETTEEIPVGEAATMIQSKLGLKRSI